MIVLFCALAALAAKSVDQQGALDGVVEAGDGRGVLPGTLVQVYYGESDSIMEAAAASRDGTFLFEELPQGRHTVEAIFTGYEIQRETVEIEPEDTVRVELILQPE